MRDFLQEMSRLAKMGTLPFLVCFLTTSQAPRTTTKAADWPQFLGPTRNCTSTETGLLLDWPKAGPPRLWEKKIGEGFSSPVVAGRRLILFHRIGDQERVDCLDTETGKQLWTFGYQTDYQDMYRKGNGPRATPLIGSKYLYTLGADGHLHCLELETGKKVWERSILADYHVRPNFFGVGSSPILEGDRLLLNVGGKGAGIVAFDASNGKEVWKATSDEASYASPIVATLDSTRHAFFFTRAGLVSLDPQDGTVRFRKPWRARIDASVNAATPVLVGDLLFISAEYGPGAVLLKVKPDGVEEVWKSTQVLSNHYNTSVYYAGHLYGIDGRQEEGARLCCVEFKTGKLCWERKGFGCASLLLVEGHLIGLTEAGEVVLIEATPAGYKEKARFAALTAPSRAEIALAHGRLYARDNERLICWNLKK